MESGLPQRSILGLWQSPMHSVRPLKEKSPIFALRSNHPQTRPLMNLRHGLLLSRRKQGASGSSNTRKRSIIDLRGNEKWQAAHRANTRSLYFLIRSALRTSCRICSGHRRANYSSADIAANSLRWRPQLSWSASWHLSSSSFRVRSLLPGCRRGF